MDFNNLWEKCLDYNIEQKPEEFKQFLEVLSNQKNKRYALEIGSNYGGTSYALCHIYDYVISLDIKHHENFDRIKEEFPNYSYIISDSTLNDTVKIIKNLGIEFDFIFIDGDHSYDGVKNDYDKYKQFLSHDGFLGFHDIIPSEETEKYNIFVHKFFNELKETYNEVYEFIATEKDPFYRKDNLFHKILENQPYGIWGGIGLIKNNKVSIFSHNYLDNEWYDIVNNQLTKLKNSGLYKRSDKIYLGVYSSQKNNIKIFKDMILGFDEDLKMEVVVFDNNLSEYGTLTLLQNYCKLNPNSTVLYYHTKGSSREKNYYIDSWRECLEYFCIEEWTQPLKDIINKECNVCGALYVESFKFLDYHFQNYFSGNFWWSSSNHINTLEQITKVHHNSNGERINSELWLGSKPHYWKSYYNEDVSSWYEHYFNPLKYKMIK